MLSAKQVREISSSPHRQNPIVAHVMSLIFQSALRGECHVDFTLDDDVVRELGDEATEALEYLDESLARVGFETNYDIWTRSISIDWTDEDKRLRLLSA